MRGLIMDYPLTLDVILRRAETIHANGQVVSRLSPSKFHRYTYAEMAGRAHQLASALRQLGLTAGDRVGTLCWNHYRHLEAYFGVPMSGCVLHTLNPRLAHDDLAYIINEAQDKALIVDESLLPVWQQIAGMTQVERVFVIGESAATDPQVDGGQPVSGSNVDEYEALIAMADDTARHKYVATDYVADEHQAAVMCYTSGTVGRPKGVVYSHRALVLHSIVGALNCGFDVRESDCLLPAVPMYHVNGWGLPYIAAMMGAKLVFSGRWLDARSLLEAFQNERVTFTAGVPTIWIEILKVLDEQASGDSREFYDLLALRRVIVGGAALPESLMLAFRQRHGITLSPAWGMTETTPMGTTAYLRPGQTELDAQEQDRLLTRQGTPVPLVEIRARGAQGIVDWDGQTMGELEVRGPCVAGEYFNRPDAAERFTQDGWFRTGDIVSIDPQGSIKIEDREKDLIKSGGEWTSSVDLENALMAHPAVSEAAVIAIPDEKWGERPLAAIVLSAGEQVSAAALRDHLTSHVAKWWLPDRFEFLDALPKTAVGKFKKSALREMFS